MLSRGRNAPSGRIRVSAPALMGRLLLAPLLPEFLRRYPALTVDLLLVDRAVDMVEEDIHLAFRVGHLPDLQIVARKIADLRMIHCAAPAYLERRGIPNLPSDLSRHDCLVFSDAPGSAEWRFRESAKSERKIRITGRLWVNSLDALVSAAKGGAGIVRVPSWQVEPDIAAEACSASSSISSPRRRRSTSCFSPRGSPRQRRGLSSIISWSDGALPTRSAPRYRLRNDRISIRSFNRTARAVVYQAPNQACFSNDLVMNGSSIWAAFDRCAGCFQFVNRIHLPRSPMGRPRSRKT